MTYPAPKQPPVWQPAPSDWLEYPVLFDPASAQRHLRAVRQNRTLRLVSLLISIGIVVAVFFIWKDRFSQVYWWVAGVSLLYPLGLLVWALICESGARREASEVTEGLALGLGREGVLVGGASVHWTQVADLKVRPARRGRGASLALVVRQGDTWRIPLDHLAIGPATLDSAVRALSGGRVWIDFSALDV